MELSTITTTVSLWFALAVMALSAFLTLAKTSRRDRHGLVDRSALDAIVTVAAGPLLVIGILSAPILMRRLLESSAVADRPAPGPGSGSAEYLLSDAWSWTATFVAFAWLYAAASTIAVTFLYFRQQRRIRATDSNA